MNPEEQWNAIIKASLSIHKSTSIKEAGNETLKALQTLLSAEAVSLSLHPQTVYGKHAIQSAVESGSGEALYFHADYLGPVPEIDLQLFEIVIDHLASTGKRLLATRGQPSARSAAVIPVIRMR